MLPDGGFRRFQPRFWGPLIGQREGLINDGADFFPDVFHVTFYGRANGEVPNYRMRPAFEAFRTVNEFLAGTTFTRRLDTAGALEVYEFQSATHTTHVVVDVVVHECDHGVGIITPDNVEKSTCGA